MPLRSSRQAFAYGCVGLILIATMNMCPGYRAVAISKESWPSRSETWRVPIRWCQGVYASRLCQILCRHVIWARRGWCWFVGRIFFISTILVHVPRSATCTLAPQFDSNSNLSKKPWVKGWFWSKRPTFLGVCTILVSLCRVTLGWPISLIWDVWELRSDTSRTSFSHPGFQFHPQLGWKSTVDGQCIQRSPAEDNK